MGILKRGISVSRPDLRQAATMFNIYSALKEDQKRTTGIPDTWNFKQLTLDNVLDVTLLRTARLNPGYAMYRDRIALFYAATVNNRDVNSDSVGVRINSRNFERAEIAQCAVSFSLREISEAVQTATAQWNVTLDTKQWIVIENPTEEQLFALKALGDIVLNRPVKRNARSRPIRTVSFKSLGILRMVERFLLSLNCVNTYPAMRGDCSFSEYCAPDLHKLTADAQAEYDRVLTEQKKTDKNDTTKKRKVDDMGGEGKTDSHDDDKSGDSNSMDDDDNNEGDDNDAAAEAEMIKVIVANSLATCNDTVRFKKCKPQNRISSIVNRTFQPNDAYYYIPFLLDLTKCMSIIPVKRFLSTHCLPFLGSTLDVQTARFLNFVTTLEDAVGSIMYVTLVHQIRMFDIALEAGAVCKYVYDNGVYMGAVLIGAGYRLAYGNESVLPTQDASLTSLIEQFYPSISVNEQLANVLTKDEGDRMSIRACGSYRALDRVLRAMGIRSDMIAQHWNLITQLYKVNTVKHNVNTIMTLIEYLQDYNAVDDITWPMGPHGLLRSADYQIFTAFGETAPCFIVKQYKEKMGFQKFEEDWATGTNMVFEIRSIPECVAALELVKLNYGVRIISNSLANKNSGRCVRVQDKGKKQEIWKLLQNWRKQEVVEVVVANQKNDNVKEAEEKEDEEAASDDGFDDL